ncbi:hypothetical protein [Acetobacter indonesiensis]|uniref:hypothetical protein n=1 Tax=Acetobacter indonesiensis TaxID=104101 RepID=UPI0020A5EC15|nr:hypothetical protein [Acetobacter indonesiensis]MCP1232174.1 hypothetical protein [Acetobacter indonesiensis]
MSRHVLHGAKNEAIRVIAGSNWLMREHMREARREGLTCGLRHIAFHPAQAMSDAQLAEFADRLCQELKADTSHMTLIIHQKKGTRHGHLILPEWQGDHVLSNRFSWTRLEKVGHPDFPQGARFYNAQTLRLYAAGNGSDSGKYTQLGVTEGDAGTVTLSYSTGGLASVHVASLKASGASSVQSLSVGNMAGTGTAYACVNSLGQIYRSITACN